MAKGEKNIDTQAPTEVVGPAGRGPEAPQEPEASPVATGLDPARTGVVDRKVEAAVVPAAPVPDPKIAENLAKAAELRANVGKPPEVVEAERLEREADDARARQIEEANKGRIEAIRPTTVAEAKAAAAPLVGADMRAGDHFAQKFGNDPENPKLAPGLDPVQGRTVRMSRKTPDHPDLVYEDVHPEMVGDYERAGWNRAA